MSKNFYITIYWNEKNYVILDRMYDDKLSIRKIVINIIIIIAETFGYSNILKEDWSSYPIPPAWNNINSLAA